MENNINIFDDLLSGPIKVKIYKAFSQGLIINQDNFSNIKDKSIDSIITDPPFNIARDTNFHTYENNTVNSYRFDGKKGWDTYTHLDFIELMDKWSAEFSRVLKPSGNFAIFCSDRYLSHFINSLTACGLSVKRTLTWYKPNGVPVNRESLMMSSCEYIIIGNKGKKSTFNSTLTNKGYNENKEIIASLVSQKVADIISIKIKKELLTDNNEVSAEGIVSTINKIINQSSKTTEDKIKNMFVYDESDSCSEYFRGCIPNFVSYNSKTGKRIHTTEKPLDILLYITKILTNENHIVLDPFSGSGSLGEACIKSGRKFILIEKDKEYYKKSIQRIKKIKTSIL